MTLVAEIDRTSGSPTQETPSSVDTNPTCAAEMQSRRIAAVFGRPKNCLPRVDDENLQGYYAYLKTHLTLPFAACYPEPRDFEDEATHRCVAVELLDPASYVTDEFTGLLCRVHKGQYRVDLPLIDLEVAPGSQNHQLIEDYWYWFWNWR